VKGVTGKKRVKHDQGAKGTAPPPNKQTKKPLGGDEPKVPRPTDVCKKVKKGDYGGKGDKEGVTAYKQQNGPCGRGITEGRRQKNSKKGPIRKVFDSNGKGGDNTSWVRGKMLKKAPRNSTTAEGSPGGRRGYTRSKRRDTRD